VFNPLIENVFMDNERNRKFINLRSEVKGTGKTPQERLKGFISILSRWSEDSEKQKLMRDIALRMDSDDINNLRSLIYEQVKDINLKNSNDLTEQILFIIIGAFKFEINSGGFSKPWHLASSSLDSILSASRKRNKLSALHVTLLGCLLILITGIIINNIQIGKEKINRRNDSQSNTFLEPLPQPIPNPYVPSHFYSLREQMGKSICQIPQALNLPAEQRAAFITFIDTGEIQMDQLANLQAALSLVHCEYTPLTIRLNQ